MPWSLKCANQLHPCSALSIPNTATELDYIDRVHAFAYLQGFGVYRFAKKYGANVDGYSPIYQPDYWSESGNEYKFGSKGLLAWYATVS